MITDKTRTIGSLVWAYFSVTGFDLDIEVNALLDYVGGIVGKHKDMQSLFKSVTQERLYVLADFLVACADFSDIARCERRRDRLYDEAVQILKPAVLQYGMTKYGVNMDGVWRVLDKFDEILDSAISIHLARSMESLTDALLQAIKKHGYVVKHEDDALLSLYELVLQWLGGKDKDMKAFLFLVMVVNYAMAFILLHLEENKI